MGVWADRGGYISCMATLALVTAVAALLGAAWQLTGDRFSGTMLAVAAAGAAAAVLVHVTGRTGWGTAAALALLGALMVVMEVQYDA